MENDLPVTGVLNTNIQLGNCVWSVRFIIAETDYLAILEMDALQKWNAVVDTCNWQLILETNGKSSVSGEGKTEIMPHLSHSVVNWMITSTTQIVWPTKSTLMRIQAMIISVKPVRISVRPMGILVRPMRISVRPMRISMI